MGQRKQHSEKSKAIRKPRPLGQRSQIARERVLKALWAMRQGDSLSKAARDNAMTYLRQLAARRQFMREMQRRTGPIQWS